MKVIDDRQFVICQFGTEGLHDLYLVDFSKAISHEKPFGYGIRHGKSCGNANILQWTRMNGKKHATLMENKSWHFRDLIVHEDMCRMHVP